MKFKIEKPNLKEIKPEIISKIFSSKNRKEILGFVKKFIESDYIYWDKMRHKEPSPSGVSKEELWMIIKIFRESQNVKSIVIDKKNTLSHG